MNDFFNENNSLISKEQFELAASQIVFLRKTIAYINAEITATYKDYDVDREVGTIYWLQPFIRLIAGELFDSKNPNTESGFEEDMDVFVSIAKQVQYIVYLNGTRKLVLAQNERADRDWGFRDFLYILLNAATDQLTKLRDAIQFLAGLETNEIPQ